MPRSATRLLRALRTAVASQTERGSDRVPQTPFAPSPCCCLGKSTTSLLKTRATGSAYAQTAAFPFVKTAAPAYGDSTRPHALRRWRNGMGGVGWGGVCRGGGVSACRCPRQGRGWGPLVACRAWMCDRRPRFVSISTRGRTSETAAVPTRMPVRHGGDFPGERACAKAGDGARRDRSGRVRGGRGVLVFRRA